MIRAGLAICLSSIVLSFAAICHAADPGDQ